MEVVLQTKFVFLELQLVSSADVSVQTASTTLHRRATVNLLCMLYHYNLNNITAAHVASALSFFVVAEAGAIHGRSLIEGSPNKTEDMFDPIIVTDYDAAAAIDYNADAEEIYWTSNSSKAIYKAPASGGNSTTTSGRRSLSDWLSCRLDHRQHLLQYLSGPDCYSEERRIIIHHPR